MLFCFNVIISSLVWVAESQINHSFPPSLYAIQSAIVNQTSSNISPFQAFYGGPSEVTIFRDQDRRAEEGWWNLYPFGEKYLDVDMAERPWKDLQIDLDFYFPFYGFRFNYSFIYPEGFIAFSYPEYIQAPSTYPNPLWPEQHDPSFIACFLSDQSFVHVGETRISHVWYRIVTRPQYHWRQPRLDVQDQSVSPSYSGRVEDPTLLDEITRDIRENMVGTGGYTADFALIVTWERMGYGGQPKFLRLDEYEQIKKWQNTYQMVLTTDEHRSYVLFNYANINYTSSMSAGALSGRGGRQSAIVGFNGGNGTGFYEFPYSAQGDSYKLAQFGSTQVKGRWVARVDESIIYGGCSNASHGVIQGTNPWNGMIGGNSINVSGPCFRSDDYITMEIDEEIFDCSYISMVKARCIVPFNMIFKTGPVTFQISQDGRSYSWYSTLYMFPPSLTRTMVKLLSHTDRIDPSMQRHNWHLADVTNLTILWSAANISSKANTRIDILLWGYREDVIDREFVEVGAIARKISNTGRYTFNPKLLDRSLMVDGMWKKFWGGAVQVRVSGDDHSDHGHYVMWSEPVPFGWYFEKIWKEQLGTDWALRLCTEWFNYDGLRDNFLRRTYTELPCPCTLDQALIDFGRFTPLPNCEMMGDSSCIYTKGAQHCVVSTASTLSGAWYPPFPAAYFSFRPESGTQTCCYDFNGWLMFSQDYEYNVEYLKYFAAGVPYRANPWGGYVFKKPLYVPSWSNFYNDLLPYDLCCRWAEHCEFYYWRRPTSGCQNYEPVVTGIAYGHGHFITFDGYKYTFNGRGYHVLSSLNVPEYNYMIQIRTEQPPRTMYNTDVAATVITGVAVQEQDSSVVQVFSRKRFRRWRYRTDIFVDGQRYFFDMDRRRFFSRVLIYVPHLVMNQSEVYMQFTSGLGVKVVERRGILQVTVALPPQYQKSRLPTRILNTVREAQCSERYHTMGLLGTYDGDAKNDLTTPDCSVVLQSTLRTEQYGRTIHNTFGLRWRTDNAGVESLFGANPKPLYYPNLFFSRTDFYPTFDPWKLTNYSHMEAFIFSRDQEVQVTCQGVYSCVFDYLVSGRREFALDSLTAEKSFENDKFKGEKKLISCGPLEKNKGVIKYPLGNNYLEGAAVSFTCQTDYYVHGTEKRYCFNGTWSPGWWVWCRLRSEENALKWTTGIIVSAMIAAVIILIFLYCRSIRDKRKAAKLRRVIMKSETSIPTKPRSVNDRSKRRNILEETF